MSVDLVNIQLCWSHPAAGCWTYDFSCSRFSPVTCPVTSCVPEGNQFLKCDYVRGNLARRSRQVVWGYIGAAILACIPTALRLSCPIFAPKITMSTFTGGTGEARPISPSSSSLI